MTREAGSCRIRWFGNGNQGEGVQCIGTSESKIKY